MKLRPVRRPTTPISKRLAQVQVGLNFSHTWQLLYTARFQAVDVLPGTLNDVPSIETQFPQALGSNKEFLNRLSLVYETRDDLTVPGHGVKWMLYVGAAAKDGLLNGSSYSEAGIDARGIWSVAPEYRAGRTCVATIPVHHQRHSVLGAEQHRRRPKRDRRRAAAARLWRGTILRSKLLFDHR